MSPSVSAVQPPVQSPFDRELLNLRCAHILRGAMLARNMTGVDLSRLTGIPTSNISRYLNGTSIIPLPAFIAICNVLRCNASVVIDNATVWASRAQRKTHPSRCDK